MELGIAAERAERGGGLAAGTCGRRSRVGASWRVERESRRLVQDAYTMPHGKRRLRRHEAHEMVLHLRGERGVGLELITRVADDGAAFRYRMPEAAAEPRRIVRELTGVRWPADTRAWIEPYDNVTQWTPSYERFYEPHIPISSLATNRAGWCFPALFQAPGIGWALMAESGLDGTYCGGRLQAEPNGLLRVGFPDPAEAMKTGLAEPTIRPP